MKEQVYAPWKKGELPMDTALIEFETKDSFVGADY
jgi:hypothetical protein